MIPISAIIFCHNEEDKLPALFNSLKDVDEIIIVDHLSTDKTAEVAKKLGAKVITEGWTISTITENDISEFELRFGYKPTFQAGNTVGNSGKERTRAARAYCKNDWIFFPDADEIVRWDFNSIQNLMKDYDLIISDFVHTRTPEGRADIVYDTSKLYRKSKCWWTGILHEYVTGHYVRIVKAEKMRIDHYQKPKVERNSYSSYLEYAMVKEENSRYAHYLGREYLKYGMDDKAKKMLQISLKTAFNISEIISSYCYIAKACWNLGNSNEAKGYLLEAMKVDPTNKDIYLTMASLCEPEKGKTWVKIAEML